METENQGNFSRSIGAFSAIAPSIGRLTSLRNAAILPAMKSKVDNPVVLALDVSDPSSALRWVERLGTRIGVYKVGLQLFASAGPGLVREISEQGCRVFLDLKLHDIPNTVAKAAIEAGRMGVHMLTLHTSGGAAMLTATREAVDHAGNKEGWTPPLLLGVTILTSLDRNQLRRAGFSGTVEENVLRLASLAREASLDGLVASGRELAALQSCGPEGLLKVIPGIRPAGAEPGDQRRVLTPGDAIQAGADYLVIGRPITAAPDPASALDNILREVQHAKMDLK